MNQELNDLIAQKKEIEQKIKALQNSETEFGRAKYAIEHYPTEKPDRHHISINVNSYDTPQYSFQRKETWRSIINGKNKEEVVSQIPYIIIDLQGLYDKLTGKE